jgi:enoyl-CoA hydratase/carnithine racemase
MSLKFLPAGGRLSELSMLRVEIAEGIVHVRLNRALKRNAINDALIAQISYAFQHLPSEALAAVISAEGDHFCAGLDLSEVMHRSVAEGIQHSRTWHAAFDQVQFARVPVVAILAGAVVGGGLELASAAHLRVADDTAFYGLPEGQRGIFVGGGGSARITRLIGTSRMSDMMLTGRVFDAHEGQVVGLSNYLVEKGTALDHGMALAQKIAANAPLSNFAITQALPRIADLPQGEGLFMEALMSAVAQGDDAAKSRVQAFLDKRADKVKKQ